MVASCVGVVPDKKWPVHRQREVVAQVATRLHGAEPDHLYTGRLGVLGTEVLHGHAVYHGGLVAMP